MDHEYKYYCTCCNQEVGLNKHEVEKHGLPDSHIVEIDTEMLPIITELNRKGWPTIACCQGGVTIWENKLAYSSPYIKFDKSLIITSDLVEPLPDMWKLDDPASVLSELRQSLIDSGMPEFSLFSQLEFCRNMSISIYMKSAYTEEASAEVYTELCHRAIAQLKDWVHSRRNLYTDPFIIEDLEDNHEKENTND